VKGLTEHGCGLEVGRSAPRSGDFDHRRVDELTGADTRLMSKDAFLGTWTAAESMLIGLRALIQALYLGMRSSER
jgi:hypothetical protein